MHAIGAVRVEAARAAGKIDRSQYGSATQECGTDPCLASSECSKLTRTAVFSATFADSGVCQSQTILAKRTTCQPTSTEPYLVCDPILDWLGLTSGRGYVSWHWK